MVTNIFTYATKELSQDAFICWLLANHDVEELQEESYRFLNLLMDTNFANGDIANARIKHYKENEYVQLDLFGGE